MFRFNKYTSLSRAEYVAGKLSRNMFKSTIQFDVNESTARELSLVLKGYVERAGKRERD